MRKLLIEGVVIFTSIIASFWVDNYREKNEEKAILSDSIITLGNEITKNIDRVIIGSLVETRPYPDCHFIHGVSVSPVIQEKACIDTADAIFVFENIRYTDPDIKTLHVVSRIMRKNKHAPIYVELDNTEHPLLNTLPRSIIPMKNHDIIHAILAKEGFDIERYWDKK